MKKRPSSFETHGYFHSLCTCLSFIMNLKWFLHSKFLELCTLVFLYVHFCFMELFVAFSHSRYPQLIYFLISLLLPLCSHLCFYLASLHFVHSLQCFVIHYNYFLFFLLILQPTLRHKHPKLPYFHP